ncbi:MAG TPA: helix-turn-helix transcriptional regulator [Pirellulaceae bacterium]|jgi:plasmid maintenance system antidote protein VapI
MTISDQLRAAIAKADVSANVLAKQTGMSQPTVSRFLRGDDIKLGMADKLADHFGLALVPVKAKAKRRK